MFGGERKQWQRYEEGEKASGLCNVPPSLRSAPSGPSLSLVRCPPRFAQGTNHRLFLGLGSRSEQALGYAKRAQHKSAIGRRFAPYPSAASDGGQKMRRSTAKTLPNLQVNSIPSQRQTHFRGAERERGWTLAQQKPSPAQTSSFLPRPQPHPITPAPCLVLASRWRAWVCWRPRSSRKHL